MIQVFGPYGMLGQAVADRLRGHDYFLCDGDITKVMPSAIPRTTTTVINCAGLVKQRRDNDAQFMLVNGYGPHRLAEVCDRVDVRLIHVSTDCVFEGSGLHVEEAAPDASDIYARSKLAGEVTRAPHLTIRTSFVGFGQRGLIAELQKGEPVRASRNLLWSGHTVETIAELLVMLTDRPDITGLLHVPGEFQSRYTLCKRLVGHLGLDTQVIEDNSFVADRRLVSTRWKALGLPTLPPFMEQLERMNERLAAA